jgi:cell division initiation protein
MRRLEMRITPLDIRKQEFRKTMRGLDSDEVYAFLTTVAEEYEAVLSDNKQLRERIVEIEERLKEYKTIETNLRNTLLTAERVTSETKENARKEASLIVREAEVEAEKAAEAIRAHTQQLRREVLELKRQKDNYLTRFRTLLESHHRVLDGFQEDFANVDKEIEEIGQKVEEDLEKAVPSARMSREKITEEFAHDPRDKATWGDEQKREDAPRPSMPGPAAAPPPEVNPFDTEGKDQGEPPVDDTQTSLLPEEEVYSTNHIDVDPIGAPDTGMGEPMNEPAGEMPENLSESESWSGDEVRSKVAKSIEDQLYPEGTARVSEVPPASTPDFDAPAGSAPGDAAFQQAQTVVDQAQPTAKEEQDQWKKYDVGDKKNDWKDYEIPESAKPKKPAKPPVEDKEVEEALSGLKEIAEESPEQKDSDPAEQDVVTLGDAAPEAEKAPSPKQKPEAMEPKAPQQPATGAPKKGETEWSMEDLRKNLSNLANDD